MKEDRKQQQVELANLFFEMGMPLEVVEQMSGIDSTTLFKENLSSRVIDKKRQSSYNNKNDESK